MMPSFKQLSEQEREAIISYITENKKNGMKAFVAIHKQVDPYIWISLTR
jgi:hypothetical protein